MTNVVNGYRGEVYTHVDYDACILVLKRQLWPGHRTTDAIYNEELF